MESILIICNKAPIGTNIAGETLRLASGFLALGDTIGCRVLLEGDGVLIMKKGLNASKIGMDSLSEALEMAELTEMPISIVKEDLISHGLSENDLIELSSLNIINRNEIPMIIQQYSTVFHM